MPEVPKLTEPIGHDYSGVSIGGPSDQSWQEAEALGRAARKRVGRERRKERKKKGPKCRDCGQRCEWRQNSKGRWSLWKGGTWHWLKCRKQAERREAYFANRELEQEGERLLFRDT